MIGFVEEKEIDWDLVQEYLSKSAGINQYTNYGPIVLLLEERIAEILELPSDRTVVMTANGTAAIHALVQMKNLKKKSKWGVSSFGFHCTKQGPLKSATIVDCNEHGLLDLEEFTKTGCDAMVVTNPFGVANELDDYEIYCVDNRISLIYDSCSSFDALRTHQVDEAISFHHTKPWGFGEGGCAVIHMEDRDLFKSLINFGSYGEHQSVDIKKRSTNGKMSDVAAAFILQRLENWAEIEKAYRIQYRRIRDIADAMDIIQWGIDSKCPMNVPLLPTQPPATLENPYVKLEKYYRPLAVSMCEQMNGMQMNDPKRQEKHKAMNIYHRIVNFPCHPGIAALDDSVLKECLSIFATP